MSRTARLEAILDIVHRQAVANQAELVEQLKRRDIQATQATVSRDVRSLGLVKIAQPQGGSRYVSPETAANGLSGTTPAGDTLSGLRSMFQQSVTQLDPGGSLLVIKTPAGFANAVGVALDAARLHEVVGTLAGDDTLLVILRNDQDRDLVLGRLQELMA